MPVAALRPQVPILAVTTVSTSYNQLALVWGVVADWLNIDATLGGAGVLLMFGVGAGLISILRRDADTPSDEGSEMVETPAV